MDWWQNVNWVVTAQMVVAGLVLVLSLPSVIQHWSEAVRWAARIERQAKVIDAVGKDAPAAVRVMRVDNFVLAMRLAAKRKHPAKDVKFHVIGWVLTGSSYALIPVTRATEGTVHVVLTALGPILLLIGTGLVFLGLRRRKSVDKARQVWVNEAREDDRARARRRSRPGSVFEPVVVMREREVVVMRPSPGRRQSG
ncbi:hypothetical protein [Rhodococcus sp. IEGM 1307]|jgi:hypothetical protein|uniref:hypothetical protein n=1 Tax=Rhodococcus sp. IEGM 1307 TaxID=3047091 RepID=UPI0024B6EBA5|nr:hypothetical protein [Rhodococcus sp. IEGM 1307]MDI9977451.1 hypothetical protein [Rhodococcus sp. IEGM 1307]